MALRALKLPRGGRNGLGSALGGAKTEVLKNARGNVILTVSHGGEIAAEVWELNLPGSEPPPPVHGDGSRARGRRSVEKKWPYAPPHAS
jgi:hypothetical protein